MDANVYFHTLTPLLGGGGLSTHFIEGWVDSGADFGSVVKISAFLHFLVGQLKHERGKSLLGKIMLNFVLYSASKLQIIITIYSVSKL
jgi:hypothetical protein